MAKGDTVSATSALTALNFQPASGVEVMITFISGTSGTQAGITDGTNDYKTYMQQSVSNTRTSTYPWAYAYGYSEGANLKIPVNNTNYLVISSAGNAGYAGVQVK